jgi:hypothetical protein
MSASKARAWRYGLFSAAIGGVASSIDSGLVLLVMAPNELNLHENLGKTIITILIIGVLNGAKLAFAFLKQSPLPPLEEPEKPTT